MELDEVALAGLDVVRLEGQTILADLDLDDLGRDLGGCQGQSSEVEKRVLHCG